MTNDKLDKYRAAVQILVDQTDGQCDGECFRCKYAFACDDVHEVFCCSRHYADDVIKYVMQGWIRAEDNLPDRGVDVLVYVPVIEKYMIAWRNGDFWVLNDDDDWRYVNDTYWMPLPEEPEEEDD